MHDGHHGMQPWKQLPKYDTYKSKYGPKYVSPDRRAHRTLAHRDMS